MKAGVRLWRLEPHPRHTEVRSWTRVCLVQHQSHCTTLELSTSECISEREKKNLPLETYYVFWVCYMKHNLLSHSLRLSTVQCVMKGHLVWIFWEKVPHSQDPKRAAGRAIFFFFFTVKIVISGVMPGTALVILLQPKDKVITEVGSMNQSPVKKTEVTQGVPTEEDWMQEIN